MKCPRPTQYPKQVNVRLTEATVRWLTAQARRLGVGLGTVAREIIERRAAEETGTFRQVGSMEQIASPTIPRRRT